MWRLLAFPGTDECASNHSRKWSRAGALTVFPKQQRRSGTICARRNRMSLKASLCSHLQQVDLAYCSDPNCGYCKNLRAAQEQLKNRYTVMPSDTKHDVAESI